MKRRLLLFFILFSSLATAQNNIYRSGGITQTVGAPTFTPGASGNIVAIDTLTGEWYVNPNRLSGSSWISAGYRLTNISGSVPPAYTPTAHQSHFVVNAANELYYWDGLVWQSVGGGGSGDATRLKFIVVNKSGVTLNKGEVVYVSGAQGNRIAVKKALATADSISANTLGVMDETVANNSEGYCVAEGLVTGLNTSAFTEGAALYLSPTTAGAITQTKPTAPNHLVLIGYCVKSNAGSGEISVHIQNGYELGELHDVYIPAPTNGQVLTYNNTNSRWEAATVADQSATNEIQTIDTFSLSGQTLSASLLNDGVAASSVTLPIVDVVAGTNVTVTKSNGVATVSATGGGGGGISGITQYIPKFNSGTTIDTSGLYWSTGGNLGIGTTSPTARLDIKGTAATDSTVRIGPELLTTGTGTGWSGTSFSTGYTHSTGTTALTADGITITAGTYYMVTVTVTGRTVGTCTATVGGLTTGAINTNTTVIVEGFAVSAANLSVATSSTFNGTITASLKARELTSPIIALENSSGITTFEIRAQKDATNTSVGVGALGNITTGVNNTTYGNGAGKNITSGSNNILIGQSSGSFITSASDNVLIGPHATTNTENVIIQTSQRSFSGKRNIAIGYRAGENIGSNEQTINIGYAASATSSGNNQIVIGNNGVNGLGANTTVIGNSSTTRTVLYGSLVMGSTTASANARTHTIGSGNVAGTYSLWATNSTNSATEPGLCVGDDLKVGIRTNSIDAGAALEVDGTTGGILFPRLTTTQRDALTPTNGLMIYNTTTSKFQGYADGAWVDLH